MSRLSSTGSRRRRASPGRPRPCSSREHAVVAAGRTWPATSSPGAGCAAEVVEPGLALAGRSPVAATTTTSRSGQVAHRPLEGGVTLDVEPARSTTPMPVVLGVLHAAIGRRPPRFSVGTSSAAAVEGSVIDPQVVDRARPGRPRSARRRSRAPPATSPATLVPCSKSTGPPTPNASWSVTVSGARPAREQTRPSRRPRPSRPHPGPDAPGQRAARWRARRRAGRGGLLRVVVADALGVRLLTARRVGVDLRGAARPAPRPAPTPPARRAQAHGFRPRPAARTGPRPGQLDAAA